jgi:hypothetical protein
MKLNKISIIFLFFGISILVFCCGKKEQEVKIIPSDSTKAQNQTVDSMQNLRASKPFELTKEKEKHLLAQMKDPYILGLRKALNLYIAGTKSDCVDEYALNSDSSVKEPNGLNSFDKEYFKSKFYVLSVQQNVMGGEWIDVLFDYKFDKIFRIWVYPIQKCYSLRMISAKIIPPDEMNFMLTKYKKLFDKDKFGI